MSFGFSTSASIPVVDVEHLSSGPMILAAVDSAVRRCQRAWTWSQCRCRHWYPENQFGRGPLSPFYAQRPRVLLASSMRHQTMIRKLACLVGWVVGQANWPRETGNRHKIKGIENTDDWIQNGRVWRSGELPASLFTRRSVWFSSVAPTGSLLWKDQAERSRRARKRRARLNERASDFAAWVASVLRWGPVESMSGNS